MAFPLTIDSPAGTAAQGTSLLSTIDHALDHRTLGSAAIAIENKLGVNSGSAAVNQLLFGQGAGSTIWKSQGTALTFVNSTFNNGTIGTPSITGGTGNTMTLGTPTINQGTIYQPYIDTHTIGSAVYTTALNGTSTLDLGTAQRILVNLPDTSGTVTLAVSNVVANRPFIVELMEGTAGSGTIVWFPTIRWSGSVSPTLTASASRKDTFGFIPTSATTFDGYIVGQNL